MDMFHSRRALRKFSEREARLIFGRKEREKALEDAENSGGAPAWKSKLEQLKGQESDGLKAVRTTVGQALPEVRGWWARTLRKDLTDDQKAEQKQRRTREVDASIKAAIDERLAQSEKDLGDQLLESEQAIVNKGRKYSRQLNYLRAKRDICADILKEANEQMTQLKEQQKLYSALSKQLKKPISIEELDLLGTAVEYVKRIESETKAALQAGQDRIVKKADQDLVREYDAEIRNVLRLYQPSLLKDFDEMLFSYINDRRDGRVLRAIDTIPGMSQHERNALKQEVDGIANRQAAATLFYEDRITNRVLDVKKQPLNAKTVGERIKTLGDSQPGQQVAMLNKQNAVTSALTVVSHDGDITKLVNEDGGYVIIERKADAGNYNITSRASDGTVKDWILKNGDVTDAAGALKDGFDPRIIYFAL